MALLETVLGAHLSPREKLYALSLLSVAVIVATLLLAFAATFFAKAEPIFRKEGLGVYTWSVWLPSEDNPEAERYGLAAAIWGTVYVAIIAVAVSLPLSTALALLVTEYIPSSKLREVVSALSDAMAALPTIVYGLWGVTVLAPLLRDYVMEPLYECCRFIPLFSYEPTTGQSILTAGILMGIMSVPYVASMIREAYLLIPRSLREAIYSLGATRAEATRLLLGYIKPVVIAAALLGFGRAAGETVAVSLVVGNTFTISISPFAPGYTIAALIANQYGNAYLYTYMESALFAGGLVLLLLGVVVNVIGITMMQRWLRNIHGK
ncbi:phosphate ABC transporter, inner membrane subunit PstC [Pyrolobus fumarii 1A]|uniref:Phosphate transport system permease protein n=1 Tax=Pyrolobus fumarii (strain DSM 11204 / 1A) TaxID=694429 RepID=G0EF88_PYRF1|nr:phosphate ABC transporter permease subunit PstC [Pyrolobus fumarii]AEM38131.1 phosphate ABC transporter, inner membrane subunit PstC [Pyrolobus fumarii 1A]